MSPVFYIVYKYFVWISSEKIDEVQLNFHVE
jgi:hypothetical protein